MKQIICAVAVCLLAGAVAIAEDVKPPGYPFELKDKAGIASFAEKTYDEVWGAVIRSLIASNYKMTLSEKDAGIIEATHVKSESSKVWGGLFGTTGKSKEPTLSVIVEAKEGGVSVMLKWDRGEKIVMRSMTAQMKKLYGEFFQRVADILYPPERTA